jgi:hypothetical protein
MENLYTYEDWRFGHVVLIHSFISSNTVIKYGPRNYFDGEYDLNILEELEISTKGMYWQQYFHRNIVDWSSFSIEAAQHIKNEQNQIFQSVKEKLFKKYTTDFEKRLKNSSEPQKLYDIEFKQCESILFGGWRLLVCQLGYEWNNNFKFIAAFNMFMDIEKYCFDTIINGKTSEITNFIHSPIFNVHYEGYYNMQACVCYLYYQWLKKGQEIRKGINPYPRIFKTLRGFQLFNAYFEKHLRMDQLQADISYVYYKMIGNSFSGYPRSIQYLHEGIKHSEFIQLCLEHLGSILDESQSNALKSLSQLKKRPDEPQTLQKQFANLEKEITEG